MDQLINQKLNAFANLCADYSFGSEKGTKAGITIDKCLQHKRPSLIDVYSHGKGLPYGPATAKDIPEPASSGEESEVDITDLPPNDVRIIG